MSRRPVRRVRREIDGAATELILYSDGTIRVKVDHPSNDIRVEVEIVHKIMDVIAAAFVADNQPPPRIVRATWRDDPPEPTGRGAGK